MVVFYALITIMPLVRHPLWSMLVGELTMIKYLGGLCLLIALLHLGARTTRLQLLGTPQAACFLVFIAWATTSFLTMGAPVSFEVSPVMSCMSFLLLFFVTLVLVDSVARLKATLLVAVGSVGFASLYVLREWHTQSAVWGLGYRPGWVTGDPNYFSLSALLVLPVTFYLLQTRLAGWERWFCMVSLALTLAALVLAASRGAFLGLAAGLLLMVLRSGRKLRTLALTSAVAFPLLVVMPTSPLVRLLDPHHGDVQSTDTRMILWQAGLQMFRENPLIGVGARNFKRHIESLRITDDLDIMRAFIAHNTYIEVAAELGLPGLLAFLGVIAGTFVTLERVRRRSFDVGVPLAGAAAEGMQVALVGYCVAIFFLSAEYQKFFWLMVFLGICLQSLVASARPLLPHSPATAALARRRSQEPAR